MRIHPTIKALVFTLAITWSAAACDGGLTDAVRDVPDRTGGTLKVRVQTSGEARPSGRPEVQATGEGGALIRSGLGPDPHDFIVTYTDVEPGDYEVTLGDLPPHCGIAGPDTVTATVRGRLHRATWVGIDVVCGAIAGDLLVVSETTGGTPTGDYVIGVTGQASRELGADDQAGFVDLAVGPAIVEVLDPQGCRVAGSPRITRWIGFDDVSIVRFSFDCSEAGVPTVDVAGLWWITTINTRVDGRFCDLLVSYDEPVEIEQTGTDLIVTGLEGDGEPWTGTVYGDVIVFGGTRSEPDSHGAATTTAVYTLTVSNGGNDLDGTEDWIWTREGADEPDCWNGHSTVSGFRVVVP